MCKFLCKPVVNLAFSEAMSFEIQRMSSETSLIWQSRLLVADSVTKDNKHKWTKERLCGGESTPTLKIDLTYHVIIVLYYPHFDSRCQDHTIRNIIESIYTSMIYQKITLTVFTLENLETSLKITTVIMSFDECKSVRRC